MYNEQTKTWSWFVLAQVPADRFHPTGIRMIALAPTRAAAEQHMLDHVTKFPRIWLEQRDPNDQALMPHEWSKPTQGGF